jgi:hypothetical protein
VYGKATGPDLDLDKQIIDPDFAREAFPKWFKSFGNVRQMHSKNLPPAGKAVELHEGDDGSQYIRAKIVEPGAIRLVDEGVYSAFSVGLNGVRVVKDLDAPGGRIVAGTFVETSLVDFPANPSCRFEVVKRAGEGEAWEATGSLEIDEDADESVKSMVATVEKVVSIEREAETEIAIAKAVAAQRVQHAAEVAGLEADLAKARAQADDWKSQYEKLASEPDPAAAPMRGTKLVIPTKDDEPEEQEATKGSPGRQAEYEKYLESIERGHPDPAVRLRATEQLAKLAGAS